MKLILFDFDGTIAESMNAVKNILDQLSSKYKYKKIEEKDINRLRNKGAREIMKILKVPLWKVPFIAKEVKSALSKEIERVPIVKGIKEVISTLKKRGFQIGILTSNSESNVTKFLNKNKVKDIDFIRSDVHIFGKARSISKVLKEKKIPKDQVVYIGDEVRDIEAAQKIGIKIIAVGWGYNTEKALRESKPDYLVTTPKEIVKILKI